MAISGAEKTKRLREKRIANGLCSACGKHPPKLKSKRCDECLNRHNADSKRRYGRIIAAGNCQLCQNPSDQTHCKSCREKRAVVQKELRKRYKTTGRCYACGDLSNTSKCLKCRERQKQSKIKLLQLVYEQYGGSFCKCCGESEFLFLTIDHVNNNGAEHRRGLRHGKSTTGVVMARWLRDNNYPSGFQVLCMNCNLGKQRNGGVCPHHVKQEANRFSEKCS